MNARQPNFRNTSQKVVFEDGDALELQFEEPYKPDTNSSRIPKRLDTQMH